MPDNCTCDDGWEGSNCTIPICPGCMGTCMDPGVCICPPDTAGDRCEPIQETEEQGFSSAGKIMPNVFCVIVHYNDFSTEIGGIITGIIGFVFIALLLVFFIAVLLYFCYL